MADDGVHDPHRRAVLLRHLPPAPAATWHAVLRPARHLGGADLAGAPRRRGRRRAADRHRARRAGSRSPAPHPPAGPGRPRRSRRPPLDLRRPPARRLRRPAGPGRPRRSRRPPLDLRRPPARRLRRRAEVPAVDGPRAAAPAPRAHRGDRRALARRADLRGDGAWRHLRPARRRFRPLRRRRRVGRAALREDAVRQRAAPARLHPPVAGDRVGDRAARRPRDRGLDAARPADARGRVRLGPGRRHGRGRRTDLRLVARPARGRPRPRRRLVGRRPPRCDGGRDLRARGVDPAAGPRPRRRRAVGGGA